jgi:hypothetical protein
VASREGVGEVEDYEKPFCQRLRVSNLTYMKYWINGFVCVGLSASEEVSANSEHLLTNKWKEKAPVWVIHMCVKPGTHYLQVT